MLFDIGIAGPIAGFLVAVPALFIGLSMSRVIPLPSMEQMDGPTNSVNRCFSSSLPG